MTAAEMLRFESKRLRGPTFYVGDSDYDVQLLNALEAGAAAIEEVERLREVLEKINAFRCQLVAALEHGGFSFEGYQASREKVLTMTQERDQLREEAERLRFKLDREEDSATRSDRARVVAEKERDQLRARVEELERACAAPEHCFEHGDNCCSEWCKSCQEGKQGAALRCAALAGDGKGGP